MRERTFRRPTVREVLFMQGITGKNNEELINKLLKEGIFIPTGDSYASAVETVENLREGCFALFPASFKVSREKADYGIKTLEDLVKIDSLIVLRQLMGAGATRLTKSVAEAYRLTPAKLIGEAIKRSNPEKPPVGFYWVGTDRRVRATTWIRDTAGAEMHVMKQKGDFSGQVIDRKPYGRNLRVKVMSRTEEGKEYEFTLSRLPMCNAWDIRNFSSWINIEHNSNDPDASYKGHEHDNRASPVCFWSASTIFSFYNAMRFIGQHPEFGRFSVNPFPIPADKKSMDFIDDLRLRSLILQNIDGKPRLSVLNKSEIDKSIGARTVLRGYSTCWFHMGKRNLDYLYQPARLS